MSKEAKIIKDLKERNERLNNQYMQEQARNYHLNYVIENDLEPRLKGYEYEIITLKSDFEAQHELTKKYAEENQQIKEQLRALGERNYNIFTSLDKATVENANLEYDINKYKSVLNEIREKYMYMQVGRLPRDYEELLFQLDEKIRAILEEE